MKVKLSYVTNYQSNAKNIENNAQVLLETLDGVIDTLENHSNGTYNLLYSFRYDQSYRLRIKIKDRGYLSTFQKVNTPVVVDTIGHLTYKEMQLLNSDFRSSVLNDDIQYLTPSFTDPKGVKNYYGWILTQDYGLNVYFMKTLSDSEIGDGNTLPLGYLWLERSTVSVKSNGLGLKQLSLNKNYFEYINHIQVLSKTETPFSSPKSNPVSNIYNVNDKNEEVLGFFEIKRFLYIKFKRLSS